MIDIRFSVESMASYVYLQGAIGSFFLKITVDNLLCSW